MRFRLSDTLKKFLRALSKPAPKAGAPTRRPPVGKRSGGGVVVAGAGLPDADLRSVTIVYDPRMDGDADPGEVVWAWVPFEEDPTQGKDRPVIIIGRTGRYLAAVALTSKDHQRADSFPLGTGSWDREGRDSFAKLDRVLTVDPAKVRREGAVLDKRRFTALVEALRAFH